MACTLALRVLIAEWRGLSLEVLILIWHVGWHGYSLFVSVCRLEWETGVGVIFVGVCCVSRLDFRSTCLSFRSIVCLDHSLKGAHLDGLVREYARLFCSRIG